MNTARAELLERILSGKGTPRPSRPVHRPVDGPVQATDFQQALWFIEQVNQGKPLYNMAHTVTIQGALNPSALREAVTDLPQRHPALRTSLCVIDGQCMQQQAESAQMPWTQTALTGDLEEEVAAFVFAPFDLESPPLARARLWKTAPEEHVLCLVLHHCVADGRSMALILQDIDEHYTRAASSPGHGHDPLPQPTEAAVQERLTYTDFARHQQKLRDSGEIGEQLQWWVNALGQHPSAPAPGALSEHAAARPAAHPGGREAQPGARSSSGTTGRLTLSPAEAQDVLSLAREAGTTAFVVAMAALLGLMNVRSAEGPGAPTVGTAVDCRGKHFSNVVGHFVNTVLIRPESRGDLRGIDWVRECASTLAGAIRHRDVPFHEIVAALAPSAGTHRTDLCPVYFVEQSAAARHRLADLQVDALELEDVPAQFDVVAHWRHGDEGACVDLVADRARYDDDGLHVLARDWKRMLLSLCRQPSHRLSSLIAGAASEASPEDGAVPRESPGESPRDVLSILHGEQFTEEVPHPVQSVREWARKAPEAIAISDQGTELTYRELWSRVQSAAEALKRLGAGAGAFVAIELPRSADLLVAVLAAGALGCPYTCLDPSLPRSRREAISSQLSSPIIVDAEFSRRVDQLGSEHGPLLSVDAVDGDSTAYVLFTSGSTGLPKGVAVTRSNMSYLLAALGREIGLHQEDAIGWHTTPSFDMSVPELYAAFTVGARVEIIAADVSRDPQQMLRALDRGRITVLQATPTLWRSLIEAGPLPRRLRRLVGAEPVPLDVARDLAQGEAYNVYGPTETTVWSTICRLSPEDTAVSIGKPLPGTSAYIVDEEGRPVPRGGTGELCLSGRGLSKGYLNLPEETGRVFVPVPETADAPPEPCAVMYRTGDLARISEAGELECLGRADDQLKVRGYRVEPGEIEQVLQSHPSVAHAVVAAERRASGPDTLIAHVTPSLDAETLRTRFLRETSPGVLDVLDAQGNASTLPLGRDALEVLRRGPAIREISGGAVTDALPDIGFLTELLDAAFHAVAAGGRISFREVRDVRLAEGEDESAFLAIDPQWWHTLPEQLRAPSGTTVQTWLDEGSSLEGSDRYEVLIQLGDAGPAETAGTGSQNLAWSEDLRIPGRLEELVQGMPGPAVLRSVPDAGPQALLRTAHAAETGGAVASAPKDAFIPAGEDRGTLCRRVRNAGADPLLLTSASPGFFDLLITPSARSEAGATPGPGRATVQGSAEQTHASATDPALRRFETELSRALRPYAAERLPEYMVPSRYRCARSLPLTPNGKVDRRSLRDALESPRDHGITSPQAPLARPLGEMLTRSASRFADLEALDIGTMTLTYAELASAVHRTARTMLHHGLRCGDSVALHLGRGGPLPVAVLAAAAVGAAAVVIDPSAPLSRSAHILARSSPQMLFTEDAAEAPQHSQTRLVPMPAVADLLDGARLSSLAGTPLLDVERGGPLRVDAPAYITFTSGSTGEPKGVINSSRGLCALAETVDARLGGLRGERVLQLSAPSFDALIFEIVSALANGACLVTAPAPEVRPGPELVATLHQRRISMVTMAPSVLASLPEDGVPEECAVVLAGEAVPGPLVDRWAPRRRVHNAYGPSEATIMGAMSGPLRADEPVTIGAPPIGTEALVLDAEGASVPEGDIGELYLIGTAVGPGYLGLPQLTGERFGTGIGADPEAPFFRTGDLVRRENGQLYFVGRSDDQVQIHGVRVEPAEVEAALCAVDGVDMAAVVDVPDASFSRSLVAFYRGTENPLTVKRALDGRLPNALLPARFILLEDLPRNASGKIDRQALRETASHRENREKLPATDAQASQTAAHDAGSGGPDRTALSADLTLAWEAVLGVAPAADDDFFDHGGHSLRAAELAFRLKDLGHEVTVADVYGNTTAAALDRVLAQEQGDDAEIDLGREARLDPAIQPHWSSPVDFTRAASPRALLLTGSTGFAGAYLLQELLARTEAHIYAVVRGEDTAAAHDRLMETLRRRGLSVTGEERARLTVLAGDLSAARLGLDEARYQELARECDGIYHCAADVNLVSDYHHMRAANVVGTSEIIRFAAAERITPLHHVSTTSVVLGLALSASVLDETSPVPEESVLRTGYVMSKWVAEQMVSQARERGVPANVYRLSRVWAPAGGQDHNAEDAFLHFLRASVDVGSLADDAEEGLASMEVDIIPADYAAATIRTLAQQLSGMGRTYHVTHPRPPLFGAFGASLRRQGYPLEATTLEAWTDRIAATAEARESGTAVKNSAVIRGTSSSLPDLGEYRVDRSAVDRDLPDGTPPCPDISAELLDRYVRGLIRAGLLPEPEGRSHDH